MSAAERPPFVWVKQHAQSPFCRVLLQGVLDVADLAAAAAVVFGVGGGGHELLLVAPPSAQPPPPDAIAAALLGEPLLVIADLAGAGVAPGCWLVARATGAMALGASDAANLARLARSFEGMQLQLNSLAQQVVTKDFPFSSASPSAVRNLLTARAIYERDNFPLPPIARLKPDASLTPFPWPLGTKETAAAPELLLLLERWVKSGFTPALEHAFVDVQDLAAHSPLVINEPGVGNFKGVSDVAVLRHSVAAAGVLSPLSNCAIAVDWKTPTALARGVKPQAALQVLALSEFRGVAAPVFFTDLQSHFLCYTLSGGSLCCYKGANGTNKLSLAEGVGLIRYFLLQDLEGGASPLAAGSVAVHSVGGAGLAEAPAAQSATAGLERAAISQGGGGGCSGASEDYGPLDCTENYDPSEGPGACSVAEAQAQHIAELQSIALALTHQLTAHGGINRKVFFQQEDE
jgi:hypothetical protein